MRIKSQPKTLQHSGVSRAAKALCALCAMFVAFPANPASDNPRILHAKELLGSMYPKSLVHQSEQISDVSPFVHSITKKLLPEPFKKLSRKIATAILTESRRSDMDPLLVLAMIQNESGFHPERLGTKGEIGLLQIMPDTAKWVAEIFKLPYNGPEDLKNPLTNIKFGLTYVSHLRKRFSQDGRLYLAAYNMGAKKLKDSIDNDLHPKKYSISVMKRYLALYSGLTIGDKNFQKRAEFALQKLLEVTRKVPVAIGNTTTAVQTKVIPSGSRTASVTPVTTSL